jgi:hypothetical protein
MGNFASWKITTFLLNPRYLVPDVVSPISELMNRFDSYDDSHGQGGPRESET